MNDIRFRKTRGFFIKLSLILIAGAAAAQSANPALGDGLFARIATNRGEIVIRLEYQKAPLTVCNFVALAEGKMSVNMNRPFYNGLTFHRVVQNFVIQAGCPLGNGSGGPGYRFPNEIDPSLKHDGPGVVAMANAGPDTNGSQFYITHQAVPHLDGGYSVFGRVVSGQNVVNAIRQGDKIENIAIIRNGAGAQNFRADQAAFDALLRNINAAKAMETSQKRNADIAEINKKYPNSVLSTEGIRYIIEKQGTGAKPAAGKTVILAYTAMLLSGQVFDNSRITGRPLEFQAGAGQVIPGIDNTAMDMTVGEKRTVIIPPELAYGEMEMGNGLIPANSFLVFEMELLEIK